MIDGKSRSESRPKPEPPRIHLVAIGNELLNAETRDTNLAWLIRRLTRKGGRIVRAVMIPDDFDAIRREIEQAKEEGIDLLVTTGGLGPTDDDCTLAAIAKCVASPLKLDDGALELVRERIEVMSKFRPGIPTELTEERKTMAVFPEGGVPLRNPAGVAPGMMYKLDGMTLIVLPGVPSEMKGIFNETLKGFWRTFFKGVCYVRRNIVLKGIPEAELWPYVRRILEKDPGVYIKSRLKVVGRIEAVEEVRPPSELPWMIVLHFSVIECIRGNGTKRIDKLIDELVRDLEENYEYPLHIDLNPGRV